MILILEAYNSFTFSIIHEIKKYSREEVSVLQTKNANVDTINKIYPRMIIISSIEGRIDEAKNIQEIVKHFMGKIPFVGIDEGFLFLAYVFGTRILQEKSLSKGR